MKDKFCKGFYKLFSNIIIRWAAFLFLLDIAATAFMMQNFSFLKAFAIVVGLSIGIPLIFVTGIFMIDFFQDIYDKGKKLTEAEKKEANMK